MDRTTLSFTFENIVTVCLMVFIGFALFGVVGNIAHRAVSSNNA